METIGKLPKGLQWHCREITQQGDLQDNEGNVLTETFEVWYRDPVECVRELLGNPTFKEQLAYAPTKLYRDAKGTERHVDEMWTGDWWWKMQVSTRFT